MTLPIFQRTIVDIEGNIKPNAQIEVRKESDNSLAIIYTDRQGTVLKSNPFNVDTNGLAMFHTEAGEYKISVTSDTDSMEWRYVNIVAPSLGDSYTKTEVDNLINNINALPEQTGHADQYLRSDGTTADWADVGAIKGVFYENNQTVTDNYTITTGKNAMSAGPITIADGVTVTVADGSTWSIV